MAEPESPSIPLAQAIADASSVDWAHAESSASTPEEQDVVRQLRHLAAIAGSARALLKTWGPLEIRSEVGEGTFGTVYRAWDPRLHREVALKLLKKPSSSTSTSVIKEARLLAQIKHPNVVTVYGADEFDGRVGIWMEFVAGRTMKEILQQQGPFGASEAAVIGRDLCRALSAVHQRGFLHRDIKAQNVMREAGGRTVLMDFGAGELADSEAAPLAGSPAYLAPEVLDGRPPTVKSDIYSLGVLLYHLVSGEFPVSGGSLEDFRERHRDKKRRPLIDSRPDLPANFVRAIDRATALDPAERPESAGVFESLLDGTLSTGELQTPAGIGATRPSRTVIVGIAATAAVVVVTLAGLWGGLAPARSTEVRYESVAILPFKNLSAGDDGKYFSDGITADIAGQLATLGDLHVVSAASLLKYREQGTSIPDIGAELGVATVLDGSVTRVGDRIRIASQLLDARNGTALWAQNFDRAAGDILTLQTEVASSIAIALKGELSRVEAQRIGKSQAHNVEAFDLYLRGRYQWSQRTEESLQRSLQFFQRAIEHDSSYAHAYAGLADAYTLLGVYGTLPRTYAFAHATTAAETAVRLDPSLGEAYASLGYAQKNKMEWSAAEKSFARAIELKPGYAAAHHWYSIYLTQVGRFPEAIAEIKMAISLDPLSSSAHGQFGSTLMMARRYDDAIAQFNKTLQFQPRSMMARRALAQSYVHKGMFDTAMAELDKARQLLPVASESQELLGDMGYVLARSRRTKDARAAAHALTERHDRTGEEVAAQIAAIYAGLGDIETAFEWLERAMRSGDPDLGYLLVEPRWDTLRGDARFSGYLTSLGFNP